MVIINGRFPVILKTPVVAVPPTSVYYEVAANGIFQVRDTAIYRATTAAELPIPGLLPASDQLQLRFPPLPSSQTEKVLAFFQAVYRTYQGEAVVILFYRPDRRKFRVEVPPQRLGSSPCETGRWLCDKSVAYGHVQRPSGYLRLGTIHSHADTPAFSSQTDHSDEQFEDGLHIVFGDFGRRQISSSAAFVANGVRFIVDPETVLDPYSLPNEEPPADWMSKVEQRRVACETPAEICDVVPAPTSWSGTGGWAEGKERNQDEKKGNKRHR